MYSLIAEVGNFRDLVPKLTVSVSAFKVRLKASQFIRKVLDFTILSFYSLAYGNLVWQFCLHYLILSIISQVLYYIRLPLLSLPRTVWYKAKTQSIVETACLLLSKVSYLNLSSLHYLHRSRTRLPQGIALSLIHFPFLLS